MQNDYVCARCGRDYKTAGAFRRHQEKKRPCEPVVARVAHEAAAAAIAEREAPPLKRAVMRARDMLRAHGVTGMDALDCITTLIFLRELPRVFPRLRDKTTYDPLRTNSLRNLFGRDLFLLEQVAAAPYDPGFETDWCENVRTLLRALKYHPDTKHIDINADKVFPLTDSHTAHELFCHVVRNMQFDGEGDTLGAAYMSLLADMEMVGKEMGQFFTPPAVVALATARAALGRDLGATYDPTCGSGGFLAAAHNRGATSVHGTELDPRVVPIALAHLTLLGVRPTLQRADFLRVAGMGQYDTVLANPPFGADKVKLEILHTTAPEIAAQIPFKSLTTTWYFVQRIIYAVRVGGRAAVVLPLGAELTGEAAAHVKLRERLLSVVRLCEVINIPGGTFANTPIKTALLVFEKVRELTEADAQPEIVNDDVLFSDFDPANPREPVNQLTVPAGDIIARKYSLDSNVYRRALRPAAVFAPGIVMRPLGELCAMTAGNYNSKNKQPTGAFPFFTASRHNPQGYGDVASFNFPEYLIFVKDGGNANDNEGDVGMGRAWYMTTPACASNACLALCAVPEISSKYLTHYMNNTVENTREQCAKFSTGIGHISQSRLRELPIPVPPLEMQQTLAAKLDAVDARAVAWDAAAAELDQEIQDVLRNALYVGGGLGWAAGDRRLRPEVIERPLGECIRLHRGTSLSSKNYVPGDVPVIGGGSTPAGHHNESNAEANTILISATGYCGTVTRYPVPVFATGDCLTVECLENINANYAFYLLQLLPLKELRTGMAQPHLDKNAVRELLAPLPPLEVQRTVAAQLDNLAAQARALRDAAASARARAKAEFAAVLAG